LGGSLRSSSSYRVLHSPCCNWERTTRTVHLGSLAVSINPSNGCRQKVEFQKVKCEKRSLRTTVQRSFCLLASKRYIWAHFEVNMFQNFNACTIILKPVFLNLIIMEMVLFVLQVTNGSPRSCNYLFVEALYLNYYYCNCETYRISTLTLSTNVKYSRLSLRLEGMEPFLDVGKHPAESTHNVHVDTVVFTLSLRGNCGRVGYRANTLNSCEIFLRFLYLTCRT
jgi:hypothetical protein